MRAVKTQLTRINSLRCKNFFKRSVTVVSAGKPYVCKEGAMNCSVSLYEHDGVTRRRTRCQFCRYQACMDAGMVYNGRVTGSRSNKSNGGTPLSAAASIGSQALNHSQTAENSFSSTNSLPLYGGEEYNEEHEEEEAGKL